MAKKDVILLGHTFNIQTTDLTLNNCNMRGNFAMAVTGSYVYDESVGTSLFLANARKILIRRGGTLGRVLVHSVAGSGIEIGAADHYVGYHGGTPILDQILLHSDSYTAGTALKMQYVAGCSFGPIMIRNFLYGLHLFADGSTANFVSANHFISFGSFGTRHNIKMEDTSGGQKIASNVFSQCFINPLDGQGQLTAIEMISSGGNKFPNLDIWDWYYGTYGAAITFDSDSHNNRMEGRIPTINPGVDSECTLAVTDLGIRNQVIPQTYRAQDVKYRAWLDPSHTTVQLTGVYAIWATIDIDCSVFEAFNSSGTDQIGIGHDGNQTWLGTFDVSTTGRKTTISLAVDLSVNIYTIKAYYLPGGSAPTTGKAVVEMRVRS